ncbi:hypothetical protein AOLI_G00068610 [Acnodon oligacanthus]
MFGCHYAKWLITCSHSLDSEPRRNALSMQLYKATVLLFLLLIPFEASAFKVSTLDYCYKEDDCNPYKWGKIFSSCVPNETKLHSPIDLGDGAVKTDSVLELSGFGDRQASWTVANIRDTVVVEFATGMTISGRSWLPYEYRVVEMMFHWGSKTSNGSEHTLNKRRFPMEMQFVGVAPGYVDVEAASHQQSGLAMMGVFIDIGTEENVPFKAISDAVTKVPYPGDSVKVAPPALFKLMSGDSRFYRYQGGQTTPPCLQNVEWIVFEKPIFISNDQYLRFACHLYYSDKNSPEKKLLVENYRPIQSSSKHQIFVSTAIKVHSARGVTQSQHAVFVSLLILPCLLQFSF